jgi:hypothetical protein
MSEQDRVQNVQEERGGKVDKGAKTPPSPNPGVVKTPPPKVPTTTPPEKK